MPSTKKKPIQTANNGSESPPKKVKIALFSLRAHLRFWIIVVVGVSADLLSKLWAVKHLDDPSQFEPQSLVLIPNYLQFTLGYNPGAVFGIAAGQTTLLVLVSVVALVMLFCLFVSLQSNQWFSQAALGMLFAGALGNMYDRLFNSGKVIDFIDVNLHIPHADPWPTFNVADMLLCVGVAMLVGSVLLQGKAKKKQTKS